MQKEDELDFLTFKEHAKQRSMWKGSPVVENHEVWIMREGNFKLTTLVYSDNLMKLFDEIIVNAVDQFIRCANSPPDLGGPVTRIDIDFDIITGRVTITNNGPGMPVYKHDKLGNRYTVEGLVTREYSGRNFKDKTEPDRVTGGINGLGIKLINVDSIEFTVETVDSKRQVYYRQTCRNRMDIIEDPVVVDLNDNEAIKSAQLTAAQLKPHTSISFIPAYDEVCRKSTTQSFNGWFDKRNALIVAKLIEMRAYQTSTFIGSINYRYSNGVRIDYTKKATVYFNKRKLECNNLRTMASLFGLKEFVATEMKNVGGKTGANAEDLKFPWYICVADNTSRFPDFDFSAESMKSIKPESVSIINGVHVQSGSHMNFIYNQITSKLKPRIDKMMKQTTLNFGNDTLVKIIKSFLFIFDVRQIPVDHMSFDSQSKTNLKIGTEILNTWKKEYVLTAPFIKKIWDFLEPKLEVTFFSKEKKATKTKKVKFIRKYKKAKEAGTKKGSASCSLFIPEGDSAEKTIRDIITDKQNGLRYNYYGYYNIQGVPVNALKQTEMKTIGSGAGARTIMKRSPMLLNNVAFGGFMDAVGLDYECHYYYGNKDPSEMSPQEREKRTEGDAQFAKLNYRQIIVAVDQDTDGIGHIFSLIIVFIAVNWPELLYRGFVKRFATPIIRAYVPNGRQENVFEFFTAREFREWKLDTYKTTDDNIIPSNVEIKYYKGLASHTPEEVAHMCATFHENVYTYIWDEDAPQWMEIMYGKDTDGRKRVLEKGMGEHDYDPVLYKQKKIKVSDHFRIASLEHMLSNNYRKLTSAIDGMVESQRKAFAGARKIFANSNKPKKVYQVTGRLTDEMCYEHGDSSMNDTIIKMAQTFTGARNLPLFIPVSNGFGDRTIGRAFSASPRYIDTQLNKKMTDLMFPRADDWQLKYQYSEGTQCEPCYYLPVLPYGILETSTNPGTGWKITVWARDYKYIIQNVKQMIYYNYPNPAGAPLPLSNKVWKPEDMNVKTVLYAKSSRNTSEACYGNYSVDRSNNTINITQLPLKIWSRSYAYGLIGRDEEGKETELSLKKIRSLVDTVDDDTGSDQVDIKIKLKKDALDEIESSYGTDELDPIEDYLGLRSSLSPNINMTIDNGVREFGNYEEVMKYWFDFRKEGYIKRHERQLLLLKFKIIYFEQIIRFIDMDAREEIQIGKKSKAVRWQILKDAEFVEIHKTNLFTPKYLKIEELEKYIFSKDYGASYDYIDAITEGMKSTEEFSKLQNKLQELKEELAKLQEQTWKSLWLNDIEELEKVIEQGIKTKWLFGTKQRIFKKAMIK